MRETVVEELRKHIQVDVFGDCKHELNSKRDPCRNEKNAKCLLDLYGPYKFYLAFENSNCDYYITEKYWKLYSPDFLFNVNVIPVVRGARLEQYEKIAPDKQRSFIFSDQFGSPKLLAEYLTYLSENKTAFLEYFEWKRKLFRNFEIHLSSNDSNRVLNQKYRDNTGIFCEMCSKLHNETFLNTFNTVKISEFYNPIKTCWNGRKNISLLDYFFTLLGFCLSK